MFLKSGFKYCYTSGPYEITKLLPAVIDKKSPTYFTVGKYGESDLISISPIEFGKARLIKEGKKIATLSYGKICSEVENAVNDLNNRDIFPAFYNFHTIKPLDILTLNYIADNFSYALIIEEHIPIGGLYSAIDLWKNNSNKNLNLIRMSYPNNFILGNITKSEAFLLYKIDAKSIVEKLKLFILPSKFN